MHCNIIIQYKYKIYIPYINILIFLFFNVFYIFEPNSSPSRRQLYIQLWYGTFYMR
jgi:hypothetical protein